MEEKKIKHRRIPWAWLWHFLLILFYITDLLYYDGVYVHHRLVKPFELLFRNLGYTHSFRFKYFYGLFKGKKACNQSTESNLISVLLLTRILVFFFISSSNISMKSKYDYVKYWIIDGMVVCRYAKHHSIYVFCVVVEYVPFNLNTKLN